MFGMIMNIEMLMTKGLRHSLARGRVACTVSMVMAHDDGGGNGFHDKQKAQTGS
jgi:hypothetical protein